MIHWLETADQHRKAGKPFAIATVVGAVAPTSAKPGAKAIITAEGELIGERVLHHPHVKEQPFTRNLRGLSIPNEVTEIRVVAVCSKTCDSIKSYTLKLR